MPGTGFIVSSLAAERNFSVTKEGRLRVRVPKGLKFVKLQREDAASLRSRLFVVPTVGKGYGNIIPPTPPVPLKEKGYYWWLAQGLHYGITPRSDKSAMQETFRTAMLESAFRVPAHLLTLEKELRKKREARKAVIEKEEVSEAGTIIADTPDVMDVEYESMQSGAISTPTRQTNISNHSSAPRILLDPLSPTINISPVPRKKDRKRKRSAASNSNSVVGGRVSAANVSRKRLKSMAIHRGIYDVEVATPKTSENRSRQFITTECTPRETRTRSRATSTSSHESETGTNWSELRASVPRSSVSKDDCLETHTEDSDDALRYDIKQVHSTKVGAFVTPATSLLSSFRSDKFFTPEIGEGDSSPSFHTPPTSFHRRHGSNDSVTHLGSRPIGRNWRMPRIAKAYPTPTDIVIDISSEDEMKVPAKDSNIDDENGIDEDDEDLECSTAVSRRLSRTFVGDSTSEKVMRQPISRTSLLPSNSSSGRNLLTSPSRGGTSGALMTNHKETGLLEPPCSKPNRPHSIALPNTTHTHKNSLPTASAPFNQNLRLLDQVPYLSSAGAEILEGKNAKTISEICSTKGNTKGSKAISSKQTDSIGVYESSGPQSSLRTKNTKDTSTSIQLSDIRTPSEGVGKFTTGDSQLGTDTSTGLPSLRDLLFRHNREPLPSNSIPLNFPEKGSTARLFDETNPLHATSPRPDLVSASIPSRNQLISSNNYSRPQRIRGKAVLRTPENHKSITYPSPSILTYPNNIEIRTPSIPRSAPLSGSKKRSYDQIGSSFSDNESSYGVHESPSCFRLKSQTSARSWQEQDRDVGGVVSAREARRLAREMGIAESIERSV